MLYSEILAEDSYKPYIQKFWILNNSDNPLYSPVRYALPNGCATIVFISGKGALINRAGKEAELPAGIYLSGQITQRLGISLKPFSKAVMVQMKPWLPPIITRTSMHELADNIVSLHSVNAYFYRQFAEVDLANEAIIIPAFYKALKSYLHLDSDSYLIQWIYNKLQTSQSAHANITNIANESGYSQRRLEQKFKTLIGITAKDMQRILQLRRLIDDLSAPDYNKQLGKLALSYGYYDQSHFIKTYQHIILESPSKFNAGDYLLPVARHFDFLQL